MARFTYSGESIQQAPDAVQNVEGSSLTKGYKSKFPIFHKLFLIVLKSSDGTIRASGTKSDHRVIEIQMLCGFELHIDHDHPITR